MDETTLKPGVIMPTWVDPRVVVYPSRLGGQGLFAREVILTGERVMVWGGTIYSGAEILAGKANAESVAVLDEDLYLADPVDALPGEDYPLNHSCDPNVWMQDGVTLIARRTIEAGEELSADYALWLFGQEWVLEPCRCGSAFCRGRITAEDWRLPELQKRYKGHFTPFLNRKIMG
jgi:hypothetical protein